MKNKERVMPSPRYPWSMSIDEFRSTGDFKDWTDETIQLAIKTLAKLTILTFELQTKKPKK
ncbi:MAG: hypothetical protein RL273_974 [Bacteroidota bacterium]|jgi:hypothetical protein